MTRSTFGYAFALASAALVSACGGGDDTPAAANDVSVQVASSPADAVSGGTTLVELTLPSGVSASTLSVSVNGSGVANPFVTTSSGQVLGVISALSAGVSTIAVVSAADSGGVTHQGSLSVTNTSKTSGILVRTLQPLLCRTAQLGLGAAVDADCNTATVYTYLYKSTDTTQTSLLSYDPAHPAIDVATTTTDAGVTVPFIVRNERGVIDRTIYDVAVLFDPTKPWTATAPQAAWNHKLFWRFGGGCTPGHVQASNSAQVVDNANNALGKGFAVASSGLSVLGNHCDTTLSAETVLTTKSHIAVAYGKVRYTISDGSSGGSIQQHGVANNYPGLLDGIIMTGTSFPEVVKLGADFGDCHLLLNYFNNISPTLWPTVAQKAAVLGKFDLSSCVVVDTNAFGLGYAFWRVVFDPTAACAKPDNAVPPTDLAAQLPAPGVYNATTTPSGLRCTYYESLAAIYGKRPDGFANRTYDNVGTQYGLNALKAGTISLQQFIDLNQNVGGLDVDGNIASARSVADAPALPLAYKSGQVVDGKGLASVPIIAYQSYNNQIFHDTFYNYSLRARLQATNGTSANQAIWTFQGSPGTFATDAFTTMDQWLTAIKADTSTDPLATKVIRAKPALAVDTCLIAGAKVTDQTACATQFPNYSDPRIAAGEGLTDWILKCQLKAVDPADYPGVTAGQVSQLQAVFPSGTCDYSKPGAGQQAVAQWSRWP
ncbi:MAG TPA: DUF6351 family protein [Caldimonas sp.]|jgi:hypothetical protein